MKNAWIIPLVGGLACWVLGGASLALHKKGTVSSTRAFLEAGQSVPITNLKLEKDHLHKIELVPVGGVGLNESIDVSAALTQGDKVLFEVADSYWHQRGVWREGGETGTWEEQNAKTEFEFRVPESGVYDLEITLDGTSRGGASISADVKWSKPWVLSFWPLGLGGLFLFGLSGFTAMRAGRTFARSLMSLGPGSKISVNGNVFTVTDRMEHWESLERVGVDFRTRDTMGVERWISISSWWQENPMDDDHGVTLWQIFMEVPLKDDEKTLLQHSEPGGPGIQIQGRRFLVDSENSGGGSLVTARDGDVYLSNYYNWAYRATGWAPKSPGEMWLECTVWRDDREPEWSLSRLLDWQQVEVEEEVELELVSLAEVEKARRPAQPFGAPQADPFGIRGGEPASKNQAFLKPGSAQPSAPAPIDVQWQPPTEQKTKQDQQQESQQPFSSGSKDDPYDWN